jgi:hypothetical protein
VIRCIFKCSQAELYSICRYGWNSCIDFITLFAFFMAKYDPAYIASMLAQIDAAEALPDASKRKTAHQQDRKLLKKTAKNCLLLWRTLHRYILAAFPVEYQKMMCEDAGISYYEKASQYSWEDVIALMTAGNQFIDTHLAELSANNVMPSTFQATFNGTLVDLQTRQTKFFASEDIAKAQTKAKAEANKAIYLMLMEMFKDAQIVFANDPDNARRFTFAYAKYLVSGTGTSGFSGQITDAVTGDPIANAIITIVGRKPVTSNKSGHYEIHPVASGKYTVKFEAAGYDAFFLLQQEVKLGITSRLNVTMKENTTVTS